MYSGTNTQPNPLIKPAVTIYSWVITILAAAAFGCIFRNPNDPGATDDKIRDLEGVDNYQQDCVDAGGDSTFDCDYSAPGVWGALAAFVFLLMAVNFVIGFVNYAQLQAAKQNPTPQTSQPPQLTHVHIANPPPQYNPNAQQTFMQQGYVVQPSQTYVVQQPPAYAVQQQQHYVVQQPTQGYVVQPQGYVPQPQVMYNMPPAAAVAEQIRPDR